MFMVKFGMQPLTYLYLNKYPGTVNMKYSNTDMI